MIPYQLWYTTYVDAPTLYAPNPCSIAPVAVASVLFLSCVFSVLSVASPLLIGRYGPPVATSLITITRYHRDQAGLQNQ